MTGDQPPMLGDAEIDQLIAWLELIVEDRSVLAQTGRDRLERLMRAAGRASKPTDLERRCLARANRRLQHRRRREEREEQRDRTGIRLARQASVFKTPAPAAPRPENAPVVSPGELACYICKRGYRQLHHFYDQLCPECAAFNWTKRFQTADLSGRIALITGARVKIGYQAAIKLLRAGCRTVVLTRFPRDAARRYAAEEDFGDWSDRLEIHGLDLRHTPSVEAFARFLLGHLPRLDFILNNACQTVRRPSAFYAHMMQAELAHASVLDSAQRRLLVAHEAYCETIEQTRLPAHRDAIAAPGSRHAAAFSQLPLLADDLERATAIFPDGQLDQDLQQIDLREINSWRLPLADVPTVELLEVHLINAVAPFVLNARLKPLMLGHPSRDKHIVNVSAVEGQFYRAFKTDKHPHTNMAKAALNMLTRTSADDYARDGIFINSVDTGWVTDEDPVEIASRKRDEHAFHPPLDIVDGAARICDPIFDGMLTGEHVWGKFLKDYRPVNW